MTDAFDQLKDFLRQMFQFDEHDLDFGIYKVLRLKRKYIERFIDGNGDDDLRAIVAHALAGARDTSADTARAWLAAFAGRFGDAGGEAWELLAADPEDDALQRQFRKFLELGSAQDREQAEVHLKTLTAAKADSAEHLETRVYNTLLNFFELYYAHGDFGYNARAANAFKVPYEADYDGADTLFHWKHKDSYYIKTGNGFHSVKTELHGRPVVFRLEAGGDESAQASAQNNNKETDTKHYRLARIEDHDGDWQVIFHLAHTSTPKTELYPRIWQEVLGGGDALGDYLYKKPASGESQGKPIFNDLAGDYDKTDGGQTKGIGQLRLKRDDYFKELARLDAFKSLGTNADQRIEALAADETATALHALDRQLNKFYVGNDADYFIHKDLKGFLTREKDRFIKNVIFSDIDSLLGAADDATTVVIARAFNDVATRIIAFLDAIETFQRGLFTLKKKIVDTHYLISVGKIPQTFWPRLVANEAQVAEWAELFKVDIDKPEQLAEYPTLPLDTRHYAQADPELADDILGDAVFDDLDEQTDGLIFESENLQALDLLADKYREQIKCIYIDPPYNTGDDGFLYKDSFRHSSWLSMIEDRVTASKGLLRRDGFFFSSIDRDEDTNYLPLLKNLFGSDNFLEEIVWQKAYGGGGKTTHINNIHEYLIGFARDKTQLGKLQLPPRDETKKYYKYQDDKESTRGKYRTQPLHTKSNDYRENLTYPFPIPSVNKTSRDAWEAEFSKLRALVRKERLVIVSDGGGWKVLLDGNLWDGALVWPEHQWQWSWNPTAKGAYANDELVFSQNSHGDWVIDYKQYEKDASGQDRGRKFNSVLRGPYTQRGTSENIHVFGEKIVKFPKPVGLVSEIVDLAYQDANAIFLDYFSGTAPLAEAVLKLNQSFPGLRKFILVEMDNKLSPAGIERVKKLCFCSRWRNGTPVKDDSGNRGLIKIQALEQYEDVLANLESEWNEADLPANVPVKYLFRPEQNKLFATLDLARPFSQTLRVGKTRAEKTLDLMETWCYLQGYWIKSRRVRRVNGRRYLAVETTHERLVVFRDIDTGEDDSAILNDIAGRYVNERGEPTVQYLDVNHDAQLGGLHLPVDFVTAADFDRGADWD